MILLSKFRPAWWLRNPHAQTLWAAKVQRTPTIATRSERLTTPDNDFIDLAWSNDNSGPLVVIFHGLTGSLHSHYVESLMHELDQIKIQSVLMHFRGCSGEPNNTRGSYHSGHSQDIAYVLETLRDRFPDRPIAATGFSLGGNALLKYLGTTRDTPLQFALSVCPPLVLSEGAMRMSKGFSKIYQQVLIKQLKVAVRAKHTKYPELRMDEFDLDSINTFHEFDHQITAPLHGYKSGHDYYQRASTLDDLINIKTPTHILWSQDDPFFTPQCIPANTQLSDAVDFELSTHGGHVAFIEGNIPFFGKNWLSSRLRSLLNNKLL